MKGLDFSASGMDVADEEEELEEESAEESEEEVSEEESEEEESEEEEKPKAVPAATPAQPARQASPEIEGFVKKSGLSAVQPSSKDASIYVSSGCSSVHAGFEADRHPCLPEHTAGALVVQHFATGTARL
jgi:hypothetical protein